MPACCRSVPVTVQVDPLGSAERHVRVHRVAVPVLDRVHVLDAEQVAGAQYRTRVVRLVDVLQRHGDVARAQGASCSNSSRL